MGFNYSFRYHMNTYDFLKHAHPAIYKIDQRKCNWKVKTVLHVFPQRCARTFLHCLWPILASLHSSSALFFPSRNRYSFWWDLSVTYKCPSEKKAMEIPEENNASGEIYGQSGHPLSFSNFSRNNVCIAPRRKITYVSNHWMNLDIAETRNG